MDQPSSRTLEDPPTPSASDTALAASTAPQASSAFLPPVIATSAAPLATFSDPGCPEVPRAAEAVECDPFIKDPDPALPIAGQCAEGEACIPFVDYPDDPCSPEIFGTKCVLAGTGIQGINCGAEGCAAGFLCVATGLGTRCAELCPLPGENSCPEGLLCGAVDIEGYGVCF